MNGSSNYVMCVYEYFQVCVHIVQSIHIEMIRMKEEWEVACSKAPPPKVIKQIWSPPLKGSVNSHLLFAASAGLLLLFYNRVVVLVVEVNIEKFLCRLHMSNLPPNHLCGLLFTLLGLHLVLIGVSKTL